ncbi:hypothetical protein Tco_1111397 [Tanacetum coccineum]|uniref:Mitochondrial protein n=1 Tax=Tanacetum coccineum TaxID=301880 RepID=A0ABQ5ILH4_9ASTR
MKTPMSSDTKLTKDEECESVDSTKYRGMIGSLLYLTESVPDIMFSVYLCACFQEAPKTSHLEAVKRIFRYIKGTTHLGLWYPKGTGIETVVYADSDHAGDYVDRKSTSGNHASFVEFECLLEINDQIGPRFILEFYSQYQINYSDEVGIWCPYGWSLLNLFKVIINENHKLYNESYVLYDRVMNPLAAQQERKPRKDHGTRRGRHSTSSSFAFDQPSSSHLNDDDDGNGEGTSRTSTPSPIRYVNSLTNQVPQVF